MKNLIQETPYGNLSGRLAASVAFVDEADIKNKKVLDIGCGYGWFEAHFLSRGVESITGTEVSQKDLSTIRRNIKDKRVSFKVASAIQMPFNNEQFDTVVSWEVIEHIPVKTEGRMFSEAHRVLKPDGVFYLSTPHFSFFANILDPAWWLLGHRHYSSEKLKRYASDHGFTIESVWILGGWWTVFSILNGYISKWVFRRRMFFFDFFIKQEDKEYAISNKTGGFSNIFIKCRKKGIIA